MTIQVLLAEDEVIVRQGVRVLLEQAGFHVIAEASDGREAVALAERLHPDVAVLDLVMPGMNGLTAAQEIRSASPATRTILLTSRKEEPQVLEAFPAGIRGYVLKSQAAGDLAQAIEEVVKGHTYLSPVISHVLVDAYMGKKRIPEDPLTPRERQVLQLIAEGKTTKEVAQILGMSVKTAEFHRTRIMAKLDVHETTSLVRYAVRKGLIEP